MYIDSESMTVQGKYQDVVKRYGDSWKIREHGNGNGNWLLTRPSDITVNGKSFRNFVLAHYGRNKLTRKLAEKFEKDLNDGKIELC